MATTADFRNGLVLDLDGQLYQITYFQHVKPGKGGAFVRTKLKNVRTGLVLERTFSAGDRVNDVRLTRRPIQFSYGDGHFYHFMDQQTFDDIMLTEDVIGEDQLRYLKEGMECEGLVHNETVLAELQAANMERLVKKRQRAGRALPNISNKPVKATNPIWLLITLSAICRGLPRSDWAAHGPNISSVSAGHRCPCGSMPCPAATAILVQWWRRFLPRIRLAPVRRVAAGPELRAVVRAVQGKENDIVKCVLKL